MIPYQPNCVDDTWHMAALTPHRDDLEGINGHCVPQDMDDNPDNGEYSGFSAARDELTTAFLDTGVHTFVLEARNWGNTQRIQQDCGWLPRSDGYVYSIGLCLWPDYSNTESCG
ncbi:MAG: hypothetical protein WEC75_03855 [Dehalococcoidia bacterium]